jgi:hypothetical protein
MSNSSQLRKRRNIFVAVAAMLLLFIGIHPEFVVVKRPFTAPDTVMTDVLAESTENSPLALAILDTLEVKGRSSKAGYTRDEFGSGWATIGSCDTRNSILQRSLIEVKLSDDGCVVLSGRLIDPYTGHLIEFLRGSATSADVQIDHVVALADAWQKGAQQLDESQRQLFANDPLNLLAVDGPANQQKGASDAASWLPPNKNYRCRYVARQIAVKQAYSLWVSAAEKAAMKRILNGCGEQRLPIEEFIKS